MHESLSHFFRFLKDRIPASLRARWQIVAKILYFGTALLLWLFLWMGELKHEIGGRNSAPIFLKVSWNEEATAKDRAVISFMGRSSASGRPASPERFDLDDTIFRWRWVLIDEVSFLANPMMNGAHIEKLEFAFDPTCDNDADELPLDLDWQKISWNSTQSESLGPSLQLSPHSGSLVPKNTVRNALNWGGDLRLLKETIPRVAFPFTLYLIIAVAILGFYGLQSGFRKAPLPDSTKMVALPLPSSLCRRRTGVALSLIFLFFLFTAVMGRPVFDPNDDFGLTTLIAGLLHVPPGFRVLFMNSLLALPLVGLYAAFPMIPWYGLIHFAVLSAATALLGWCIVLVARPKAALLLGATFLICAAYLALTRVTFTLVAGIASGAGWIGLGTAFFLAYRAVVGSDSSAPPPKGLLFTSAFLLFFGSLFRFEASLLVTVLLLPFALYMVIATGAWHLLRRPSSSMRRILLVTGFSMLACFVTHFGDRLFSYRISPGWSSWHELNKEYATLIDYYPAELRKAINEESIRLPEGWTFADVAVLSRFYNNEAHLRAPEFFAAITATISEEAKLSRESFLNRGDLALRKLVADSGQVRPVLGYLSVLLLSGLLLLPIRVTRHLIIILVGTLLLYVLVSVTYKTAPYRVTYSLLFACAATSTLLISANIRKRPSMSRMVPAFGALVLVSAFHVAWHLAEFPARRDRSTRYLDELQAMVKITTDPLLIFHMPGYAQPVLSSLPDLRAWRAIPISGLPSTPLAKVTSQRIGREGLVSMMQKDGRALLVTAGQDEIDPLQWSTDIRTFEAYLGQHLAYPIQSHVVKELSLWRIVEFTRAGEENFR